jgi:hypothetical protein
MSALRRNRDKGNKRTPLEKAVGMYSQENAAAELEAKDKEIERLSNIIHAVDVASRRKLKDGETVYNILSAIQTILEAE